MDFLTEILVSCAIGILLYFVLVTAGLDAEKAKLTGAIIGSWVFVQIPNYTRYDSDLKPVYVGLRSYFVGFFILSYTMVNVLGLKPVPMNVRTRGPSVSLF